MGIFKSENGPVLFLAIRVPSCVYAGHGANTKAPTQNTNESYWLPLPETKITPENGWLDDDIS